MLIEPTLVARHWGAILAFLALVVVGQPLAVALGAFLTGNGVRTSVQAGMSLAQIGEFSFILASLGMSLGATRDFLYPLAVAVSAITTLTTPWAIRGSERAAAWIDRKLPARIQTVVALYGSWVEQLRASPNRRTFGARVRRIGRALLIDATVITGIIIGASIASKRGSSRISEASGIAPWAVHAILAAVAALLVAPFCVGLLRNTRALGMGLASAALPEAEADRPDLAAAPRQVLVALVQLGATLLVLLPVVAITQPFLPSASGAAVLVAAIVVLGIAFWRSAANLQGHVRAGAQVIVEVLAKQGVTSNVDALSGFRAMFPGLGEPVAVRLNSGSAAVGRTLSDLGVRGRSGASVLAISRGNGSVMVPTASELLQDGDMLALAGTRDAIEAARELLGADWVSRVAKETR
jgi:CPA2 family monovalent cation:H+ antiporter-2